MDFFDRLAKDFDLEPLRVELASKVGDSMIQVLSPATERQIMDYGAGTGLLTFKIQPYAASITAVDTSPNMLEVLREKIAQNRVPNIQTLLWNVETDPLLSYSFDAIIGSMVMHHIGDTQNALNRFHAMIVDGGRILLADLDPEEGDFHPPDIIPHHQGFDRDVFGNCLARAGFVDIQFSTAYVIQKPTAAGIVKEYPVFLAVAQK
ncbi:MAG TPA: class I SAM-dependent methyltransferase [bacterium]|nr:class I SAM-dependent methyltransferase [bacterium]HPO07870.1 class I SAM-dependent methyltransferase [bacterium]HQO35276.1 class I SAM-dependent methyltransferase [bacterium]HQP99459.1 class I SAM-dependent methyltransferase [bacterium]